MLQELVANIEAVAGDIMDGMHTAVMGELASYDMNAGTAQVKPTGRLKLPDGTYMDYPMLNNVPVMMPCYRGLGIGIPIKAGDRCLLVFLETAAKNDFKFDLTNAVAMVGCFEDAPSISLIKKAIQQDAVIITNGGSELAINKDAVMVKGNLSVDGSITYTGVIGRA